jgi:hypothetical protein
MLRRLRLRSVGYDIETEMLIRLARSHRLGADHRRYSTGRSKLRPVRDTWTCLGPCSISRAFVTAATGPGGVPLAAVQGRAGPRWWSGTRQHRHGIRLDGSRHCLLLARLMRSAMWNLAGWRLIPATGDAIASISAALSNGSRRVAVAPMTPTTVTPPIDFLRAVRPGRAGAVHWMRGGNRLERVSVAARAVAGHFGNWEMAAS